MKSVHRLILAFFLNVSLPLALHAAAPIIDDSENFAAIDGNNGAATERPLAQASLQDTPEEENVALARDIRDAQKSSTLTARDNIQALQQDIQELRGQIEVQAHELNKLKEQQLAFYKDLDARIQSSRQQVANTRVSKAAPSSIAIGEPNPTTTNKILAPKPAASTINVIKKQGSAEEVQYTAAYELVNQKHYEQAISAMTEFVATHPASAYNANAEYWLGELYMIKKDYSNAITHFNTVLNDYAKSNKAAASHLKLAYALLASGQAEDAKKRLREVIKNYPDTETAQLAAIKLQSIHS